MHSPEFDLSIYDTYEEAYEGFEWELPSTFNIAHGVCDQWAEQGDGKRRVALQFEDEDGSREQYTFWQLARRSNRVANALRSQGVGRGTRVGVILPQRPETLIAHLGVLKAGGIVVPLSVLYGTDGLQYRLDHSETEVAVVGEERAGTLAELEPDLDALETVVTVDETDDIDGLSWERELEAASPEFEMVGTDAEESAYIIYTSGTTGKPKGAHHAHRSLLGYVPGWQFINEFPGEEAVHYTPSGWSWVGGLFAVVWSAWYHGQPVVGYGGEFEPASIYELMERYGVTNPLLTSTMLRMMMEEDHTNYDLAVSVVPSGGEKVTENIYEYVEREWGATVNEIYGQTECNFVVVTNHQLMDVDRAASGKPAPGHEVDVIDTETGEPLPDGETGHIAVRRPDPSMLLEYWQQPELTNDLYVGDWMKTGDAGSRGEDGFIHYEGRADEVIITSGYRVSPLEIEDCLRDHDAVNDAVVRGIEHDTRGTIVKAFVKPAPEVTTSESLVEELQAFVREREAAYKYPREVEFVAEFPTTVSGKVQRHKLGD